MMRFYIAMVNVNPGLTIVDVQNALTNQIQWYRVATNVWVVHTRESAATLSTRLHPLITPSGTLFIAPLDISGRKGWMPQPFWDWVNQRMLVL